MSAHALHLPARPQMLRWTFAAFAIVLAHAAAVAALVVWYKRTPPETPIIPAIIVSLAPAAPVSPVEEEKPIAAEARPRIDPTPEPSQVETKAEPPPSEEIKPPPRPAEVVLPRPEPKPIEKRLVERKLVERKPVEKKPVEKKPVVQQREPQQAQERAASREALRQSSVAASNAYKSLVYGHLQRFKSSASTNGARGHLALRFVLSRTGSVLSASIAQSSGNAALDAAALAIVRSANPFPPFPAEMTGSQAPFNAPMHFD